MIMRDNINVINTAREEGAILSRREDILENLFEIGTLTDDIIKIVNEESDIKILKKWLKVSIMVESLEEFLTRVTGTCEKMKK